MPGYNPDRKSDSGPFDIIGDVHGCAAELEQLLQKLGYTVNWQGSDVTVTPPEGRRALFLGDLTDRGPRSPDVLRIAMQMELSGAALVIVGNHDDKLKRMLAGRNVSLTHGLADTAEQMEVESEAFGEAVRQWLDSLPIHLILDEGKLVVAHAGLKEELHGKTSGAAKSFSLYGDVSGKKDEYGLAVRGDWAASYSGAAKVVYGHTPAHEAVWKNNTICIDTGCVFGGKLTALRYPELELVQVPALEQWYAPIRPLQ